MCMAIGTTYYHFAAVMYVVITLKMYNSYFSTNSAQITVTNTIIFSITGRFSKFLGSSRRHLSALKNFPAWLNPHSTGAKVPGIARNFFFVNSYIVDINKCIPVY